MKNNLVEFKNPSKNYRQHYLGIQTVVLGATGFIGRWVARNLCEAGAKICLPVRDKAKAQKVFERYNIEGEIYELNLRDFVGVRELIQQIRPTVTFNLAGYGINRAEQVEESAYEINAHLVKTVCAAIAEIRNPAWTGQDVVHVGTAMEYGSAKGNLAENSIAQPTALYGKSKLAGTETLMSCCRSCQLKGLTARLFAVYGPGELSTRLLPTLIKAAHSQEPIDLTAGLHERDFVYVEDAAEGLLRLGLVLARPGEIVNIATGRLTSIREFTEIAADVLSISDDRLKFGTLPTRTEEMNHESVTIERLRQLTGWMPKTAIAEGVRKTLAFEQPIGKRNSG